MTRTIFADPRTEEFFKLIKNASDVQGPENYSESKIYRKQWLTSINFLLPYIIVGMAHGYSTILINGLETPVSNSSYSMKIENGEVFGKTNIIVESSSERTWIVSIMLLANCPGCLFLTIFGKVCGRKTVLISSIGLFLTSWVLLMFSESSRHIFISRILAGFSSGILTGLLAVYQGECTIPKLRPTLNAAHSVCFNFGVELSHAAGTWFHWRTVAFLAAVISASSLCSNCFVPESPVWLVRKRKLRKAIESWTCLRGTRDLDELKFMYVDILNQSSRRKSEKSQFFSAILSPGFYKPLGVMFAVFTVSQMSGLGAVLHYCLQIITEITGPDRAYVPTLILDTFRLAVSIGLSILTRRYSLRTLTLFSAFSTSFFLILLSLVIYLGLWMPWFPLMVLFSYEVVLVMGLSSLPWAFCSEIFSGSFKEIGVSLSSSFNYFLFFIVLTKNPDLISSLHQWGTFLFYGIFTLIGSIICCFILPYTKNKTLQEIELMFLEK